MKTNNHPQKKQKITWKNTKKDYQPLKTKNTKPTTKTSKNHRQQKIRNSGLLVSITHHPSIFVALRGVSEG